MSKTTVKVNKAEVEVIFDKSHGECSNFYYFFEGVEIHLLLSDEQKEDIIWQVESEVNNE